ncbi:unnamed protein product [Plutella xylostella]|uniref:(diamondback moth) hypothetical protein n=1 Tax=Plutella xylostella TaxID=51655 RepID=A0A8S4DHJ8_PLUXY|nr:unnamed protein product [Plutella xylostella]
MVNQAFVNVGRDLASKISPCAQIPSTPKYGLSSPIGNSLVILPVDNAQVERLVKSLRSNCATGWDDIPAKILKNSSDVLVPPITHLCNLAINSGIFPLALKNAIVHPIYKSGDKESVTNYRPISVLSSISKILERILNNCLTEYLDKYQIIARNQYGFRAGVSTEDAVADFSCAVVSKLDKQFKCYGIFLDLSKAFDTVSVPILMTKLEQIGIRGITLQLFCDYLTDRSQCVKIDSYVSKNEPLSYGVPQGSILGPTLFLVYINDLCTLKMPNTEIFTYADDTALLIYDVDWESAKLRAESSLRVVMEWLSSNLLTLNLSKTQYLCFNISNRVKQNSGLRIKAHYCSTSTNCQCPTIDKTDSIRYLGVILDDKLNWGSHINSLYPAKLKLSEDFIMKHFLAGLLLKQVEQSLREAPQKRRSALGVLRAQLTKHEHDDRYAARTRRARVARLYAPWLTTVLDIAPVQWGQLEQSLREAPQKRRCALGVLRAQLTKHEHDDRYAARTRRARVARLYAPWLTVVLAEAGGTTLREAPQKRRCALGVLRAQLTKHEHDDRYAARTRRARVARLYAPWLTVVLGSTARRGQLEQSLRSAPQKRRSALGVLRAQLTKHEHDDRYAARTRRARVARLYAPWLTVVLGTVLFISRTPLQSPHQNAHRLVAKSLASPVYENGHDKPDGEAILHPIINNTQKEVASAHSTPRKNRLTLHFDHTPVRNSAHFKDPPVILNTMHGKDQHNNLSHSSLESVSTMSGGDSLPRNLAKPDLSEIGDQVNRFGVMSPEEVRDVLLCFLFVLKYLDEDRLVEWWKTHTPAQTHAFFNVLE